MIRLFKKWREGAEKPTVLHITHHKSGSQWIANLLHEAAPFRYVQPEPLTAHFAAGKIRAGMIYPTIYLSREKFEAVLADEPSMPAYQAFYSVRDLRDTLVSLYFSLRYSHEVVSENVRRGREMLESMDELEGMKHLLKSNLRNEAAIQRSWLDSDVTVVRYEDLLREPETGFREIFTLAGIEMPEQKMRDLIGRHSFRQATGRDPGEQDQNSHHRKGISGDWENYFSDEMKDIFKESYGELLIATGYEEDDEW